MQLYQPTITGSLAVSGSIDISGSITLASGGSISGTASLATTASYAVAATSASYAASASNALASATASYVLNAVSASYAASASNALSASNAVTAQTASYANTFTVGSTLTAQTLVVQTITSSVDFVTGSTRFGTLLSNTHVFSGSVTMNPGGLFVSSSGFVGLNKSVPQRQYTQVANANGIVFTIQNAGATNEGLIVGFDTTGSTYLQLSDSTNAAKIYLNSSGSSYLTGGNVGIGTTNPLSRIDVVGISGSSGIISPVAVTGYTATTNVGSQATSYGGLNVTNGVDSTLAIRTLGGGHVQLTTDANGRYISFATGLFTERVRITSGGYLQLNGASNNAAITTDSSANVMGLYTTGSVIDGIARIEVTGTTYPSTPSTVFIRANTVAFTLNSASTETMRINSSGQVGIGTNNPIYMIDAYSTGASTARLRVVGTTNFALTQTQNTSGVLYMGIDSSTADGFGVGNYSRIIWSSAAYPLVIAVNDAERMRISSAGVITQPSQPIAIGALVSDQSISATTFTTLNYDTGTGYFSRNINSAWNNSTRTLTAPATGTYLVSVSSYTNNIGQISMFVNGSRTISIPAGVPISTTTTWGGSCMVYLTSGDALTLRGYGDGSGTLFANGFHTWFQIRFLG